MIKSFLLEKCFRGYDELEVFDRRLKFTAYPEQGKDCPLNEGSQVNFIACCGQSEGNQVKSYILDPIQVQMLMNDETDKNHIIILATSDTFSEQIYELGDTDPAVAKYAIAATGSIILLAIVIFVVYKLSRRCISKQEEINMNKFVEDEMEKSLLLDDAEYMVVDDSDELLTSKRRPGELVDLKS